MTSLRSLFLLLALTTGIYPAQAFDQQNIPDLLKPWVNWVMADNPEYQCPFFYGDFQQKRCSWAGTLNLDLEPKQGRFEGTWTLHQQDWIELPGDDRSWPQQVMINQKPAIVVERQGKPAIQLPAGHYRVTGFFYWDKLPESLALTEYIGLIRLSVDGKSIAYPHIDQGALWLTSPDTAQEEAEQDSLDLQVFRQVKDDNPLQVITRLEFYVSGKARELNFLHALLPQFIPVRLDSALPARIESDGRLLVQVRAGHWTIDVAARHPKSLTQLDFAVQDADWPKSELWAFQAMPGLRLVEIDSLPAVDASQTNMPPEWRHLPAYQIKPGQNMHFKLIRRGDPEPAPNQLRLTRKLWLDFDGKGYTVSDKIDGKMSRDWRLNALEETRLGQVLLNGQNQLITDFAARQGVEVRRGSLQIQADSRIENDISLLNAVGWQQSFRQVDAELNIPPGWRLLAVNGVDNAPDSWLTHWTLLDLFLVLISALAVSRLWCWQWGLLALFSLMLFWHESDAPRWIWLHTLAALALLRVVPESRFSSWIKTYRNLCWLALIVIVVPFMVDQIRIGLYPQLERSWQTIMPAPYATDLLVEEQKALPMQAMQMAESAAPKAPALFKKSRGISSAGGVASSAVNFDRIDPEANLQTGPGLPQWHWHSVQLSWNGSVDDKQQIRLWFLSPPWSMLMHILIALLSAVMTSQMLGIITQPWRLSWPKLSVWLLLPLLIMPNKDGYADIPDPKLLEQLKNRMLEEPQCLPACAQIPAMNLEITPDTMTIELQIHVQRALAVPLPARLGQWFPEQVGVDGDDAHALIRQDDGSLWLGLTEGVHKVVMRGIHLPQNKFVLPLPLNPQHASVGRDGWRVDGVYENGKTE
ncbi:MAG: hypothetical protein PHH11_08220 [Methylomonas sp.]|nr:hypothetical protein [Methylomonas sp.]